RAVQDDLAHLLLELRNRYRDLVVAHAEEAADADDRVRHRLVRRDDQVVDLADLLTAVVVDVLAEDLLLRAPAGRHLPHLGFRDADHTRSGRLRHRISSAGGDDGAGERHKNYRFHGFLLSKWSFVDWRCPIPVSQTFTGPRVKDYARHAR